MVTKMENTETETTIPDVEELPEKIQDMLEYAVTTGNTVTGSITEGYLTIRVKRTPSQTDCISAGLSSTVMQILLKNDAFWVTGDKDTIIVEYILH